MSIQLEVGTRIKTVRERFEYSQADFALKVGLENQSQISKIEKGLTQPALMVLRNISQKFGVSTDYLVWGAGSENETYTIYLGEEVGDEKTREALKALVRLAVILQEIRTDKKNK